MRLTIAIAALLALAWAPAAGAREPEIAQTHEVRVGELMFVKLPGQPDLGYEWRINEKESSGLDLVSVDPIGWLLAPEVKSIFFKEKSVLNVAVEGRRAGRADIAFDYFRRIGGRTMARTSIVRVVVKPRDGGQ